MKRSIILCLFLILVPAWIFSQNNIRLVEYWYDNQYSSRVVVNISPPKSYVDTTIKASTTTVSNGFHIFNMRTQDTKGKWSAVLSSLVYTSSAVPDKISKYEYWFDNNYSGKITGTNTSTGTFTLNLSASVASLNNGFHLFNIRFSDNTGKWTFVNTQVFIKKPVIFTGYAKITRYEYWFDNNYSGRVKGTYNSTGVFSHYSAINVASLNPGMHYFNVRYADSSGKWTPVSSHIFIKMPHFSAAPTMAKYEYWFDNNYSGRKSGTTTSAASIVFIDSIDIKQLSDGIHAFNIAFTDNTGKRSAVYSATVQKTNNYTKPIVIKGYRYYFDQNGSSPHYVMLGNGQNPFYLDTVNVINAGPAGYHKLQIQFVDQNGRWSPAAGDSFYKAYPVANFTVNNKGCDTLTAYFKNSSIDADSFYWTFGDNTSSTLQNPSHFYAQYGTYTATLKAINKKTGFYSTKSVTINIFHPVVNLGNDQEFCYGQSTTLDAGSGFASYKWSDNSTNRYLTVSTAGKYSVTAIDTNGCLAYDEINITVNPLPLVSFSVNDSDQCLSGNNFSFSNNTTGAVSHDWFFGDGASSTQTSPTYTYSKADTFTVKLISTSSKGCKDSASKKTIVFPMPKADFSINIAKQCLSGNIFAFSNSSTGNVQNYWSFGDGQTSSQVNPTHTYNANGDYDVKLVVTSVNNCKDSQITKVTVYPMPKADFSVNKLQQCLSGNNFTFTNTGSGFSTTYWTFGDNSNSSASNPSHTYTDSGIYVVKLLVTSVNGCKDSLYDTVEVWAMPQAKFTVNQTGQCLSGNNFVFSNNSIRNVSNYWLFGDNNSSSALNTSHSYLSAGNYTVKLTVTTQNGCSDSSTTSVSVYPMPIAAFEVNDTDQCFLNHSFVFTDKSSLANVYLWDFGDGTSSTTFSPVKSYISHGTYKVWQKIESSDGCRDSVSQMVYVYRMPVADFEVNDSEQCLTGNSFIFTNKSAYSSAYTWNFGDGNESTLANTSHQYSSAGNYQVQLIAATDEKCTDSRTLTVLVHANPDKPVVKIIGNIEFCQGDSVVLEGPSGYSVYQWSNAAQNQKLTVKSTENLTLIVYDSFNCPSPASDVITTNAKPIPPKPVIQNPNIDELSSDQNADDYLWFRNDTLLSIHTKTITNAASGTYRLKIVVNGCESVLSDPFNHINSGIQEKFEIQDLTLLLYPNPTQGLIHLNLYNITDEQLEISLLNIQGKVLRSETVLSDGNVLHYETHIGQFEKGMYLIRIKTGKGSVYSRILLQ